MDDLRKRGLLFQFGSDLDQLVGQSFDGSLYLWMFQLASFGEGFMRARQRQLFGFPWAIFS